MEGRAQWQIWKHGHEICLGGAGCKYTWVTFALGMTAVAYLVLSAISTVASIALNGLACGPTKITGLLDCKVKTIIQRLYS